MTALPERASPLLELTEAIDALLCPQLVDGGMVTSSLLDQLEEAAESSGGLGSGKGSLQKAPAALDVLGLLTDIDHHVLHGLRRSQYRGSMQRPRAELLRVWMSHAGEWRAVYPDYLYESIGQVRRWVLRARNILTPDPQTIETQAQPCPVCRERTAFVWSDDLGERVQRPSLYLDKDAMTVYCRCCHASWGPRMWAFLRKVLDDNRLATNSDHSARLVAEHTQ
jgi:hypothetical protein